MAFLIIRLDLLSIYKSFSRYLGNTSSILNVSLQLGQVVGDFGYHQAFVVRINIVSARSPQDPCIKCFSNLPVLVLFSDFYFRCAKLTGSRNLYRRDMEDLRRHTTF